MKKFYFFLIASILAVETSMACADYDPENDYYNLFIQEIIDAPQYYPFLLTYEVGYYSPYNSNDKGRNENIEEWQHYLGISYDDAYYLVFKAAREDVRGLLDNKSVQDKRLNFANAAFVKKHKQALLYLAYAKYLEPYMAISQSNSGWNYYYDENQKTADQLDYEKVITVLTKSWNAEKDNELKLRYGYQLVRLAHYNRNYQDAIGYFDKYVEPLNYKPAMYYHALSQKAGAERGLGYIDDANYNFFTVFTHSRDLKTSALSSIRFTENVNFERFLKKAQTKNEINDAYLLLGYISFSNPLSGAEKILQNNPDAIQAKVLIARAINLIERNYNRTLYYSWNNDDIFKNVTDRRYPVLTDDRKDKFTIFFDKTLELSVKTANQTETADKNFWYLTASYLNFLKKDFSNAKSLLAKVEAINEKYAVQKTNLSMYIDISEQPKITSELEIAFYDRYKNVFKNKEKRWISDENETPQAYNTRNFVIDVLANRYYLQEDYAKSFFLNHDIMTLEDNPQPILLDAIESFYQKTPKNDLEKFILSKSYPWKNDSTRFSTSEFNIQEYIEYMRGNIYLAQGNLTKSLEAFKKLSPNFIVYRASWEGIQPMYGREIKGGEKGYKGFEGVSNRVFGYNRIECFECEDNFVMQPDYLDEFPFIKTSMNKRELVESLIELEKIGKNKNEKGAKANYLIGNFFYNVTKTGFYRHLLRFDLNNGICEKYRFNNKTDIFDNIYFKYYPTYFDNNVSAPQLYLEKAYAQAKDNELKARIAFALSKWEQAAYYDKNKFDSPYDFYDENKDRILIKNRKYFAELQKYKGTDFHNEVRSNCLYFDYYVRNY